MNPSNKQVELTSVLDNSAQRAYIPLYLEKGIYTEETLHHHDSSCYVALMDTLHVVFY